MIPLKRSQCPAISIARPLEGERGVTFLLVNGTHRSNVRGGKLR